MSKEKILNVKKVLVSELKTAEYNPRDISQEKLALLKKSIEEDYDFLYVRPIIVNSYKGRENVVIGGNMRLEAAKQLGLEEIPAVIVSVPIYKEKAWNIKDNVEYGIWDLPKLKETISELEEEEYNMELLGFSEEELLKIMDEEVEEDNEDLLGGIEKPPVFDVIVKCENQETRNKAIEDIDKLGYKYIII